MDFTVSAGCDEARRSILYLMAASRNTYERIVRSIEAEELGNPEYIKFFDIMRRLLAARDMPMADIVNHADSIEEQQRLSSIFAMPIELDRPDLDEMLIDHMRLIKRTYLEGMIAKAGEAEDIMQLAEFTAKKVKLAQMAL